MPGWTLNYRALNRIPALFVLGSIITFSVIVSPSVCRGQTNESERIVAERILNDGIVQELVYGNLEEAEDLYYTVVRQYGHFRRLAAQALIRMAGCKEKKKAYTEARDIYIRVIREYINIEEAVLFAQSYLQELEPYYHTSEMTIISPNGNENIDYNNDYYIRWFGGTEGGKVRIELLKDDIPHLCIEENTENSYIYRWIALLADPQDSGNDFTIRISDVANPENQDVSDSTFAITILEVLKPDDDDVFAVGDDIRIVWTNNYWMNSVKIELLQRGIVTRVIVEKMDNLGEKIWTIPDDCRPGYDYQIRVTDMTLEASNESWGYFTITP